MGIADDDTHGYDQVHRDGPDYDCSSFVGHALAYGGFNINPSITTEFMAKAFEKMGWQSIAIASKRKKGDVFLVYNIKHHHVVLCVDDKKIVHASSNEYGSGKGGETGDQTGTEICVKNYYVPSGGWTYHFRYPQPSEKPPAPAKWEKAEAAYLSESQKQNNARKIFDRLSSYGWKLNPIAATLGNIEQESTINPGLWQSFAVGNTNLGYGLCQWTPATKIIGFAQDIGGDKSDGDLQLDYLHNETTTLGYWVKRHGYDISFKDFQKSTKDVKWLTSAFMWNYENPGKPHEENRWAYADKWQQFLSGYNPQPPVEPEEPEQPVPPAGEKGNLWPKIDASGFNTATLSKNQKEHLTKLNIGDRIYLRLTQDRGKKSFGTDFWGKRLHQVHDQYTIRDVRKDGYIVLQYKNEFCTININPKHIGGTA